MIEEFRRRGLRQLNTKYIYGKYPLLHIVIFCVELIMVALLVRKFNTYYAKRPVLTTMITNAILGGIADTTAQSLTAIRQNAVRRAGGPDPKSDSFAIEIHELDRKIPFPEEDLIPDSRRLPPPFDFERLTRFMSYGFIMAPLQHKWFGFLSRTFPLEAGATAACFKRVAFDQLIFAPAGLACFFSFMTVCEGGGHRDVLHKLSHAYLPTLKANFIVWPAVQLINFAVIPLYLQIPFVSTIGIVWTAYLSLSNASD